MEDTETPAETPDSPAEAPAEAEDASTEAANSPLEEADRINKEKKINLDREEALIARREKLLAEERVGGRSVVGKAPEVKEISDADYAKRAMAGEIPDAKE